MKPPSSSHPWHWRLLDAVEALAARLWPQRLARGLPFILLLPVLALVGILLVGVMGMLDASLRTLETSTFQLSDSYSLDNYRRALTENLFQRVAIRSFAASALVTCITLVLAFPYAWLMVRTCHAWLRKFLLVALFFPFFIGEVVRAYGWLILLGNQGMASSLLQWLGLPPVRLLYNHAAVVFGLIQYMLPFAILMMAPALTAIPRELESAAASLGANRLKTFVHVTLPLSRPGLVAAGLVVMTLSLTSFAIPAMLGGGSRDFLSNVIYDQFFRTSDQGLGSALSILLLLGGSAMVAVVFALFGMGSLSVSGRKTP